MPKYNVTMQVLVSVRIPGIEAESQEEALKKADQVAESNDAELHRLFNHYQPMPGVEWTEYSQEADSYLVDEEGDTDFSRSQWYDAGHNPL